MTLKPEYVPRSGSRALWGELRLARNACRDGMTHYTGEITSEQQESYRRTYSENVRHFLYRDQNGNVVGFSRLEYRYDGFIYPTYGVIPEARGKGYAWEIVRHAMLAAGLPLRGDLLMSNHAIMRVDFALGWKPSGPPIDGVLPVESPWPPRFVLVLRLPAEDMQRVYDEIIRYQEER